MNYPSVLILVAAATGLTLTIESLGGEVNEDKSVRASELLKTVQIVGILGRPLGQLTTIRGTWRRVNWKDAEAVFRVSKVNGKSITSNVEFTNPNVRPIWSEGNPAATKGAGWDWKAARNGKQKPPSTLKPKEGEEWEMMGAEKGDLVVGLSKEFWNEIGGAWIAQRPLGVHPVYTFIAARRLQPAK